MVREMELVELRKEIDLIDDKIFHYLAKRMSVVKEVAKFKKTTDMAILDEAREKEILTKLTKKAIETGLDKEFIEKLYILIMDQSKKEQTDEV